MNKRIKELALQAGGSHYPDVGGITLEKFAELLVKECGTFTDPVTRNLMMKYFGFEE